MGLPVGPALPLVGLIGRLTEQKGIDLVAEVMQEWVQTSDVQWAILGTGDAEVPPLFETLSERYPAEGGRAAGVLRRRWPIASRPAPTCSSCPAASSPAG